MNDWQPIATLPEDVTWFLGHGREISVAAFCRLDECTFATVALDAEDEFRPAILKVEDPEDGWYPTHWMPLPDPPAAGPSPQPPKETT